MAKCKSCGAEIFWAKSAGGKSMPINSEPSVNGNLQIVNGVAQVVIPGTGTHVSHHATCPQSKQWHPPKESE